MNPDPQDVDLIIQSAIDALKRGDTVSVTRLARQAATIAPDSEIAWLLLATVAKPEDSLAFVQEALKINPQSQAALEALAWAQGRLPTPPPGQTFSAMETDASAEVEPEPPTDAPELPDELSSQAGWMSSELEDAPETPVDEQVVFEDAFSLPEEQVTDPEDAPAIPEDETAVFDEAFSLSDGQSTELEDAPVIPADETVVFDEAFSLPGEMSTELEEAPVIPADETVVFDEAFSLPGEMSTELEEAAVIPADDQVVESENQEEASSAPAEPPPASDMEPEQSTDELPATPEQPAETNRTFPSTAPKPVKLHGPVRRVSLTDSRSPTKRRKKRSVFSTLLIFLASALVVVVIAALLGLIFLRPQLSSLWANIFPSGGCQASLVIGPQTYRIWPIGPEQDGTYDIPENQPGRAYYVQDTASNYVFFLSSASDNQTFMTGLRAGETGSITWSNCATNSYRLFQPVAQILDIPVLLNQNITGITIIVPWPDSSSGFVLKGTPENFLLPVITTPDAALSTIAPEQTADVTSMPINITGLSGFLTEIALLETIPSADLSSIQVSISIKNQGNIAGQVTTCDVGLTPEGGTPLAVLQSEPALPFELAPGASQTMTLTFPRPSSSTAILKILNMELDLEGY